ncbi:MAG: P-II family nitrogen regulator [Betaproteobacteria bacterium]|nr:P-II family nitrogen regulator [Betaproteobacteria bacterium]
MGRKNEALHRGRAGRHCGARGSRARYPSFFAEAASAAGRLAVRPNEPAEVRAGSSVPGRGRAGALAKGLVKLIVAIIRADKLDDVEEKLKPMCVERFNVSKVRGYGEYRNFFSRDWVSEEVRIEIFTRQHKVDAVTTAIMEAAHTGIPRDGVVAVVPIDKLYLVRSRSEVTPENFWPKPEA